MTAERPETPEPKRDDPFGAFAGSYEETVNAAISASGESFEFFADLRSRLTAKRVAAAPVGRILDFGCGVGASSRHVAARFATSRVTGFDVSQSSIAVAETHATSGLDFVYGADGEIPCEDQTFDLVVSSCVFHHIERDEHLHWATEIARVLKPGGSFFVYEHNPYNLLTRHVVSTCPFDEGVTLMTPTYTSQLLRQAGFIAGRPYYYFFYPHFLSFMRRTEPLLSFLPLGGQYYVMGRK